MSYKSQSRTPYPNELYHYGVKGMRKGKRRWTNPDGTLTEAGKIHYGISTGNNYDPSNRKGVEEYRAQKTYVNGDIRDHADLSRLKEKLPGWEPLPTTTANRRRNINLSDEFDSARADASRKNNKDVYWEFGNRLKREGYSDGEINEIIRDRKKSILQPKIDAYKEAENAHRIRKNKETIDKIKDRARVLGKEVTGRLEQEKGELQRDISTTVRDKLDNLFSTKVERAEEKRKKKDAKKKEMFEYLMRAERDRVGMFDSTKRRKRKKKGSNRFGKF